MAAAMRLAVTALIPLMAATGLSGPGQMAEALVAGVVVLDIAADIRSRLSATRVLVLAAGFAAALLTAAAATTALPASPWLAVAGAAASGAALLAAVAWLISCQPGQWSV